MINKKKRCLTCFFGNNFFWIDTPGLYRIRCVCSKTRFCFAKPLAADSNRTCGLFLMDRVKPSLWQRKTSCSGLLRAKPLAADSRVQNLLQRTLACKTSCSGLSRAKPLAADSRAFGARYSRFALVAYFSQTVFNQVFDKDYIWSLYDVLLVPTHGSRGPVQQRLSYISYIQKVLRHTENNSRLINAHLLFPGEIRQIQCTHTEFWCVQCPRLAGPSCGPSALDKHQIQVSVLDLSYFTRKSKCKFIRYFAIFCVWTNLTSTSDQFEQSFNLAKTLKRSGT